MLNKQAPAFTLEATTGHSITLSELQGTFVVLIFYPANDTPVCNSQLNEMSINTSQLSGLNARIFGVNTASAKQSKNYCTRKKLEFPILSDPGGDIARSYGAYLRFFGMNRRVVVVIDPSGRICFYEKGKPSPERIIECIVQEAGQLAPAGALDSPDPQRRLATKQGIHQHSQTDT